MSNSGNSSKTDIFIEEEILKGIFEESESSSRDETDNEVEELDLDLGDLNYEEDSYSKEKDELDLLLDLQLNESKEDVEAEELKLKSDQERLKAILGRLNVYSRNTEYIKELKGFNKNIYKILTETIKDDLENEGSLTLDDRTINQLKFSIKKLKNELDRVSESFKEEVDFNKILENISFPEVIFSFSSIELRSKIENIIKDEILSRRELLKQYITVLNNINPQLNNIDLATVHLTNIRELEIDNSRNTQTVVCPVCSKRTEHTLLKFDKSYKDLRGTSIKYLYAQQPLVCDCSSVLVLSKESEDALDEAIKRQYKEDLARISQANSDLELNYSNILEPNNSTLQSIPEIHIKDSIFENIYEKDITQKSEALDLYRFYSNLSNSLMSNKVREIIKQPQYEKIAKRLILYNGYRKINGNNDIRDILLGTFSQIPIVKVLVNLTKKIKNIEYEVLVLEKINKAIEFLLSNSYGNNSNVNEFELETSSCVSFIREEILMYNLMPSKLENFDGKSSVTLEAIKNIVQAKLEEKIKLLNSFKESMKNGKNIIRENPIEVFGVVDIFRNDYEYTKYIFDIFDSEEEAREFIDLAYEHIGVACWYKYNREIYTGRLSRSQKAFRRYEDVESLDASFKLLPSISGDVDISDLKGLFNSYLPGLKVCLNELSKPNSKYKFIYRLISLLEDSRVNICVKAILDKCKNKLSQDYFDKYEIYSLESFNTYFVLLELGFSSEEIKQVLAKRGEVILNNNDLKIINKGETVEEYIDSNDERAKYVTEQIFCTSDLYDIIFNLKILESFNKEASYDLHSSIKQRLFINAIEICTNITESIDLDVVDIREVKDNINIFFINNILNKGKAYMKLLLDGIKPINREIIDVFEEDFRNENKLILLSKANMELTEENILNITLFENEWRFLDKLAINSEIVYLACDIANGNGIPSEIVSLVPENLVDTFLKICYLVDARSYSLGVVSKFLTISREDIVSNIQQSIEEFLIELKDEVNGLSFNKIKSYMESLS